MKTLLALLFLSVITLGFYKPSETITVKGSDTMVILAQRWAELYMAKHPEVSIQVTGGGSGTGISALINGTTDIATSSRPMKKTEKEKLKQRYNTLGVEIKTAKDGLAIYVNESNAVKDLTLGQLKLIYTGAVTNWKQIGGSDTKIILYSRENNSGTYVYFKDHVLDGDDFAPNAQNMPGTAAVVNAIAKDKNGIGYGGSAYAKGVRIIRVKKDEASPPFEPSEANIKSGDYPISRYLYMYTRSKPTGTLKAFIDWTLGSEGQSLVTAVGYFPVR